jgi:hypothetical protein
LTEHATRKLAREREESVTLEDLRVESDPSE